MKGKGWPTGPPLSAEELGFNSERFESWEDAVRFSTEARPDHPDSWRDRLVCPCPMSLGALLCAGTVLNNENPA